MDLKISLLGKSSCETHQKNYPRRTRLAGPCVSSCHVAGIIYPRRTMVVPSGIWDYPRRTMHGARAWCISGSPKYQRRTTMVRLG